MCGVGGRRELDSLGSPIPLAWCVCDACVIQSMVPLHAGMGSPGRRSCTPSVVECQTVATCAIDLFVGQPTRTLPVDFFSIETRLEHLYVWNILFWFLFFLGFVLFQELEGRSLEGNNSCLDLLSTFRLDEEKHETKYRSTLADDCQTSKAVAKPDMERRRPWRPAVWWSYSSFLTMVK